MLLKSIVDQTLRKALAKTFEQESMVMLAVLVWSGYVLILKIQRFEIKTIEITLNANR